MSSKTWAMSTLALLFCASACAADDSEMPKVVTFAQAPEAEEFRASYDCASEGLDERNDAADFYCLTRCEGLDEPTAVHEPFACTDSWCLSNAAHHCAQLGRELEAWCWDTREVDD